ncbi:MAG: tetratricopeptide repeat protein, partial [Candidatus Sulfotelmatobacter sp.]
MQSITIRAGLLVLLVMLSSHSLAKPVPQEKVSMDAMTAADLEKAGDVARGQKDYAQAIQYFQAALRKNSRNSVVYNKLGLVELKTDNLNSARLNFQKAAKQDSKFADAVNNIGAVDYMRKKYGSAEKHFRKAVALDETRATFHVNLGAAWFSEKNMDRAIAEYTRALE